MHITDEFIKERMIVTACVDETEYELAKELLKTRRNLNQCNTQRITAWAIVVVLLFILAILFTFALKYRAGVC